MKLELRSRKSNAVSRAVLASGFSVMLSLSASHAANLWDGGGSDGNWSTALNWDDDTVPTSPAALTFGGTNQLNATNDLSSFQANGFTFDNTAGAFVIGGAAITLGGDITNNSASLQTINLDMATTAVRTINAASGDIALGGVISGTGGGITKTGSGTLTLSGANTYTGATAVNAGTLKLGASNALPTSTALTLATGGTSNTLDLAGFTQTVGSLTSSSTNNSAGTITSSVAGGALTVNVGGTTGNTFGGTLFSGSLALTVRGANVASNGSGNIQILNASNSFSGGLTIKGSSGSFTTASLSSGGQFTGLTMAGVRSNATAAIGSGTVTLDNGQLFMVASLNVANSISVTTNGGILHMESTGSGASGGFTGAISSTGSTLLAVNSNAGNSNIIKFTGDLSGFSGTLALDTTNIGGIRLSGSALGNSNMNLLWSGNGANGGTGRVQAGDASSKTYTFGELNNLNSGAVGSTASGIIENAVAATTATFSIGDTNASAATFQGVIRNSAGTVALTKTGTNTQVLTGANTYTGATSIDGGTLRVNGSLSTSSAVSFGGTGATLAGSGSVGAITLSTGNFLAPGDGTTAIGTLSASALTLNGGAFAFDLSASDNTSDLIALTGALTDAGASYTFDFSGGQANQTYTLITFGSTNFADASKFAATGVDGTFNLTGNSLTFTAVPEPNTWALVGGFLAFVAVQRRIRRRFDA